MPSRIHPLAGKPVAESELIDVAMLIGLYFSEKPNVAVMAQRVTFGTSGHRGHPEKRSFNEPHVLAICQAICDYRPAHGIDGPLFIGRDTHALSEPAFHNALEVFCANGVDVFVDRDWGYTPTPVISHAILTYNKGRAAHLAEGIVISPSHNPPDEGGLKYNPAHGGPADIDVTRWVEVRANELLEGGLRSVKRMTYDMARNSSRIHLHDYVDSYIGSLSRVIDMDAIRDAKVHLGIDPLGGAPIAYWDRIIERYGLDATVFNTKADPTFRFLTHDWDGKIRMDCSSPYAMGGLLKLADLFDVAIATDTDADRHGIVCPQHGLMNASHYLAAAAHYLCTHRPHWPAAGAIAKTVVTSGMIERVAASLGRKALEFPVGFKWFGPRLLDGSIVMAGEESAGAAFLRRDGSVWTTDKDGIVPGLLAAEMTAKTGRNPILYYREVTRNIAVSFYDRIDNTATPEMQKRLGDFPARQLIGHTLAGETIETAIVRAPANDAAFGGFRVATKNGWFATRPSGTEAVYKIYSESFISADHLARIQEEAQKIVEG
jgi:phosphoglucomutase